MTQEPVSPLSAEKIERWEKLLQFLEKGEYRDSAHEILHDIATPTTVVSLNLDLLQDYLQQPDCDMARVRELVERIAQGSDKLEAYIREIQKLFSK